MTTSVLKKLPVHLRNLYRAPPPICSSSSSIRAQPKHPFRPVSGPNFASNRLSSQYPPRHPNQNLRASFGPYLLVILAVAFSGAAVSDLLRSTPIDPQSTATRSDPVEKDTDLNVSAPREPSFTAMPVPDGQRGNLTPDQEAKLRQLWVVTLKTFGVEDPIHLQHGNGSLAIPPAEGADQSASELESPAQPKGDERKKKRMSIFRKRDKGKENDSSLISEGGSGATTPNRTSIEDDKYGQVKEFHDILATQSPESLRATFWSMVKADHPDSLLLRFLRARKWDVDRALVMLISTMKWRGTEMHVDDDVMKHGEGGALEDAVSTNATTKKDGDDFLTQLRLGKSFLHGVDKEGRPLCVVRARLHRSGEQSEKSLERYTVYVIETARLVLRTPVETACILFDMTHFTMANMDYAPVKFMIKIFEANYPESLGAILVHKAPWIFQGIWNIIKGWLDPVVAGKVHFTKHVEDLEAYIPKSQIIKELGGVEDWSYTYIEPVPGENDMMKDEAPRLKLEEERNVDVLEFQKKTFEWIHDSSGEGVEEIKKERDSLAEKLNSNYWMLDPYIRARTVYDRQGMIEKGGKINFYPTASKHPTTAAVVNGETAAVHAEAPSQEPIKVGAGSADDVD